MKLLKRRTFAIIAFALSFVTLVSLACQMNLGGAEKSDEDIPVSTEAVEGLKENWSEQVQNNSEGQTVTLTVDEAQLTSLIALELQKQDEPILTEPQVFLRNGQIEIFGKASKGLLKGNVHLTVSASVNEQGEPDLEITSAEIGTIPVPDGLLDTFSTFLDESFTSRIGSSVTGFQVQSIEIQDGLMTVSGVQR